MAYYLISKVLCILLMQSKTIVFLVSVPLLKLDHEIDRLGILNALNTEQCFYIDDTDTTKFDKVTCDIRRRSHQCYVTDLTDFNNIITDKTMTSLDQLQGCLALTDTTLTCDQDSLAVNINQHTMNRNTWCKLHAQPADDLCHKAGSCSFCHECRNIIFNSQIDHVLRRTGHGTENNTWDLAGNETFIFKTSLLLIKLHQIRILYISDDLNSFIGKMLQISGKLKRRSVDLRSLDHDA